VVVRAEPVVGFMHRGAEKLFEVRDYRQLMMLANRHDWLSAFSNELGICLASSGCSGCRCRTAPCGCARCWPS
jgi:NADH:ubiquinone oxidoreductase subunit D